MRTMLEKKRFQGLMFGSCQKAKITVSAPKPYTGQRGPLRNPRFTREREVMEQRVDSYTQPKKLYRMSQRNIFAAVTMPVLLKQPAKMSWYNALFLVPSGDNRKRWLIIPFRCAS